MNIAAYEAVACGQSIAFVRFRLNFFNTVLSPNYLLRPRSQKGVG